MSGDIKREWEKMKNFGVKAEGGGATTGGGGAGGKGSSEKPRWGGFVKPTTKPEVKVIGGLTPEQIEIYERIRKRAIQKMNDLLPSKPGPKYTAEEIAEKEAKIKNEKINAIKEIDIFLKKLEESTFDTVEDLEKFYNNNLKEVQKILNSTKATDAQKKSLEIFQRIGSYLPRMKQTGVLPKVRSYLYFPDA